MRCSTVVLLGLMAGLALASNRFPKNTTLPPPLTRRPNVPKVTRASIPKVTHAPVAKVTRAPASKVTRAHKPGVTAAPIPKVTRAHKPGVTAAPIPKVTRAHNHGVTGAPVHKGTHAPAPKVTRAPIPKVTRAPVISTLPPLPPFNPNPKNFPYLQSETFLKELNEGRLDAAINMSFTKIIPDSGPSEFGIQSCSNIISKNTGLAYMKIRREGCPAGFANKLVYMINKYRARHQARPLTMKMSYNRYSQKAANNMKIKLYNETKCHIQAGYRHHVTGGAFRTNVSASAVAQSFYIGMKGYHSYGKEPTDGLEPYKAIFTQLVWANTTRVGVGCTTFHRYGRKTRYQIDTLVNVVVTFGKVRGNKPGEYAANVLPPNDISWTDYKVIINEKSNMNFDN